MRLPRTARACFQAGIAALVFSPSLFSEEPRLNQIQVIGSHNSYHRAPPAAVLDIIGKFRKDAVTAWDYTHPPLTSQLGEHGIRQFELDIYADPEGGLFSSPLAVGLAKIAGKTLPDFDPKGDLKNPGFKILHVPDLDCWSNNATLSSALFELSDWSSANPAHLPVMILIECKDDANPPLPTKPTPFTRPVLLELEEEILKVIKADRIFRPDDLRGDETDLPTAIRKKGWPELSKLRGKFLFALDNEGAVRDRYLEGNPALQGRLLFVSAPDEKNPAAGWFKCNDPVRQFDRIQSLVKAGFLVRTRADGSSADPVMRERAFSSGAQWVSTDHFSHEKPDATRVTFGGKPVRTNPLIAPQGAAIEP